MMSYWFMVFCHELAHNVESYHNETHENAMSEIAVKFLNKVQHGIASDVVDLSDV